MEDGITRVLLVEDDEDDRLIAHDLLADGTDGRFEVTDAATVAEGVVLQRARPHDVVLMDLSLPDSSGSETYRRFLGETGGVPVILLTGMRDEELAVQATREGVQDYLLKAGLNRERLVRSIRFSMGRQQVEAALRDSTTRLQEIIEQDPDAMVVVQDERILFANRAAERLFGVPRATLLGQSFSHPVEPERPSQVRIPCPSRGCEAIVEMHAVAMAWNGGRGRIVHLRDITSQVQAEEALEEHRGHLEELVRVRTDELKRANETLEKEIAERREAQEELRLAVQRLEAHDRARSQFVYNVSHELKTPLASLHFATENLMAGAVGELPPHLAPYVRMMQEDCQRLIRTVNDILDLSRLEMNRLHLHRVPLPLAQFVRRRAEAVRMQCQAKHLSLDLDCPACGFVLCDPAKMERIVGNVLDNAIKYTPAGGRVRVQTRGRAGAGALASQEPCDRGTGAAQVQIVVTDSGIGIAKEHLARVTERYFRASEEVSGTGLGLALSKEMVEAHGGRLAVESPPEGMAGGTRVTIGLPATAAPRVLIADDDAVVQGLLAGQIGGVGYDPVCCGSGEEAIRMLAAVRPQLIIMDLFMPGLDGAETIARIKSDPAWRHIPILAVTGRNIGQAKREILDGFGVPALGKPWREDTLLNLMEEALYGHGYLRVG